MSIEHYTYRIRWSTEDEEFVGTVAEFPTLSWLDPNQAEALLGIRELVADVVSDMLAHGETPPKAGSSQSRLPSKRVSLNRLAALKLV